MHTRMASHGRLKISHPEQTIVRRKTPAVTVVRAGTSQAKHMLDNLSAGTGRLPDEATRKRMAELVDAWPPIGRA